MSGYQRKLAREKKARGTLRENLRSGAKSLAILGGFLAVNALILEWRPWGFLLLIAAVIGTVVFLAFSLRR